VQKFFVNRAAGMDDVNFYKIIYISRAQRARWCIGHKVLKRLNLEPQQGNVGRAQTNFSVRSVSVHNN
jgi:hypothetical protein